MDLTIYAYKNLTQITIKTGLHIILTTDDDDSRLVYISGNFNNWLTQDRRFLMEIAAVCIILNLRTILIILKHFYTSLQRRLGEVEIDSDGNITIDQQQIIPEFKKSM
jgi:hypothetical protein